MKTAAIALSVFCLSSAAFANDSLYIKDHMEPFVSEMVTSPINLSGFCVNVQIIEWRATPGYQNSTSQSNRSKNILDEVCNLSVRNFRPFISKYGFVIHDVELFQTLSLMPADINNHGLDLRNLNDSAFRFFSRYKEYDEEGNVIPIWGYHSRISNHIFIRNDVLNENGQSNFEFRTVFAHELYHAMSYQFGVFDQYSGNAEVEDEKMARKFTKYLSLGE